MVLVMPTLKINKSTNLSPQDCFSKITDLFENDKELQKLDPGYKCEFDSSSLSGTAKGSQFKASMNITPSGSGSELELTVDLPFHLGLVKGLVQKTLEKKVDALLG
ncbi:MAG: hypothetical protein KDD22_00325 [Bdellovibrionales bacterium]|nr:hypothetical protein [Bdellovibrionales bacterium]